MGTKSFFLVLAVMACFGRFSLFSDTTINDKIINFGDYTTSNWRSSDFKGSASRQWDPSGKSFCFDWNTESGDQIGRMGVTFGSRYLGAKIDEMPSNCIMSTACTFSPTTNHWFYWAIYGWTNGTYTYWGNTPSGWNNEFYIIFHTDRPTADFVTDKGVVAIGSVDVDRVTFDCFRTPRSNQSQWFAVTRSKTWNASVNLKKIFDYWRSKGLANESIVDLGWAVEGFIGSAGKLQLTNVTIPNLSSSSNATKETPSSGHQEPVK